MRATSVIVTALAEGAGSVIPVESIDEAKALAAAKATGSTLLAGERDGLPIPGFDLGNSPFEYLDRERVAGKIIYFYTTNGSGAIRKAFAGSGSRVYIAALLNVSAVSATMVKTASAGKFKGIGILCSGRKGETSEEDNFCAGLMVDRINHGLKGLGIATELGGTSSAAARYAISNRGHGLDILRESEHGQYLESLDGKRVTLPSHK